MITPPVATTSVTGVRDGLVIVDKQSGLSSHDVVSRMRRIAHTRKVGHAGTLDPMATGVLVLGVGRATRLLHHLVLTDKSYLATIRLGRATVTDDAEGERVGGAPAGRLDEAAIRSVIATLTGPILQVPSSVSAIKVDGRRAYHRVRDGEAVALPARPVTVSRFELLGVRRVVDGVVDGAGDRAGDRAGTAGAGGDAGDAADLLDLDVVVDCSSGTYIRALARDLGAGLLVGGHLTALRRTRVGPFGIVDARTLEQLAALDDPITLPLPAAVRAAMPVRLLDAEQARTLSFGRSLPATGISGVHGALDAAGTAIALLEESDGVARPVLVFTPAG